MESDPFYVDESYPFYVDSMDNLIFVGSMGRQSSQQLEMWFSEHIFAPKLAT